MRVLAIWIVLVTSLPAVAQVGTSVIKGTVTDESGAAIAAARIEVNGHSTDVKMNVTSDKFGWYLIQLLPTDRYQVSVSASGFKTFSKDVELPDGVDIQVDAILDVKLPRKSVPEMNGNVVVLEVWSSYGAGGFKVELGPEGELTFKDFGSGKIRLKRVPKMRVISLLSQLRGLGFFDANDFGFPGIDGPSVSLSVQYENDVHSSSEYEVPPRFLRSHIATVLNVTGTRNWARKSYKAAVD